MATTLDRYARWGIRRVAGYMAGVDARLWHAILRWQAAEGIEGHLGEIGVYRGRSFGLLALARREGERAFAVDPFEDGSHAAPRGAFEATMARIGRPVPSEDVLAVRSTDLSPADLTAYAPARFVHIDGDHRHESVRHDAVLARSILAPDGVMVFDDVFDPAWPDVTRALIEMLGEADGALALAAATNKAYVVPRGAAARYAAMLRSDPALRGMPRVKARMMGDRPLHFRNDVPRRVRDGVADAVGRFLGNERPLQQPTRRG